MTPDASTERQSLQRGEPAQRAASETSAGHWLPTAQCPIIKNCHPPYRYLHPAWNPTILIGLLG